MKGFWQNYFMWIENRRLRRRRYRLTRRTRIPGFGAGSLAYFRAIRFWETGGRAVPSPGKRLAKMLFSLAALAALGWLIAESIAAWHVF